MRSDIQGNRIFYYTRQGRRQAVVLSLLGLGLYGAPATQAEETPAEIFNRICASCHNSNPPPRAMHGEALRALPAEKVFFALDKGLMAMYVMSFNQERKKELAEFITGKPLSATAQGETPEELQRCAKSTSLPADALNHPHWSGWGIDLDNTRFQPAAQAKLDRSRSEQAGVTLGVCFSQRRHGWHSARGGRRAALYWQRGQRDLLP